MFVDQGSTWSQSRDGRKVTQVLHPARQLLIKYQTGSSVNTIGEDTQANGRRTSTKREQSRRRFATIPYTRLLWLHFRGSWEIEIKDVEHNCTSEALSESRRCYSNPTACELSFTTGELTVSRAIPATRYYWMCGGTTHWLQDATHRTVKVWYWLSQLSWSHPADQVGRREIEVRYSVATLDIETDAVWAQKLMLAKVHHNCWNATTRDASDIIAVCTKTTTACNERISDLQMMIRV